MRNDPITHRPLPPPPPFAAAAAEAEKHIAALRIALDDLEQSLASLIATPAPLHLRAEAASQLADFASRLEHCRASEAIRQGGAAIRRYAFFLEAQARME